LSRYSPWHNHAKTQKSHQSSMKEWALGRYTLNKGHGIYALC
jgi:hypothetical protein